jgi:hypothetical protein
MEPSATTLLAPWSAFYVILGSGGAALTGLQFVAMAIAAEAAIGSEATQRAFATPTVVHFCYVLLVSALLSAPWPSLSALAVTLGVCAVAGVLYALTVLRHARRQTEYEPVLEDWIWHAALPLIGYGMLVAGALELRADPSLSLFVVAAASLLLLFVGIHNSWDGVTFIVLSRKRVAGKAE